ncbi:MAG TPA: hypothetical protein VHO02_06435 [Fibrobacteria bacterium]|nr:hypothetical protein [Fibrobacteria bacterium]
MKTTRQLLTIAGVLLLSASSVLAQGKSKDPKDPKEPKDPPAHAGPNENASDNAKAVQLLLKGFKEKRDKVINDRKALIDQLKTASGDERQRILDELRADQKARSDEERALAKEIRDELKKLRDARKNGGG